MISNYLTKKHRMLLKEHPKYEPIDVCNFETIKRYIEAIEFVRTYNWMYTMKLKYDSKYVHEYMIWDLRYEISAIRQKLKGKNFRPNNPYVKMIENRIKYMKKHLLLKHRNIDLFND